MDFTPSSLRLYVPMKGKENIADPMSRLSIAHGLDEDAAEELTLIQQIRYTIPASPGHHQI